MITLYILLAVLIFILLKILVGLLLPPRARPGRDRTLAQRQARLGTEVAPEFFLELDRAEDSWEDAWRAAADAPLPFPDSYGVDEVVAVVKDPWWIYAYWDLTGSAEDRLRELLGDGFAATGRVLRIYDLDEGAAPGAGGGRWWQIPIPDDADHWFIETGRPGHRYAVEIGRVGPDGTYHALICSQPVLTPFAAPDAAAAPSPAELYLRLGGLGGGAPTSPGAGPPDSRGNGQGMGGEP